MSASLSPPMVATREEWAEKLASHMKTVDPKWIEVDDFISSTLHHEEEVDVSGLLNRAADAGLPPIAASASITSLMGLHAYASSTTHALEIGTLAGLTSIRLAKANPQLHVTTVELHDLYADVARANIKEAGLEDRIEVVVGQAADVLPRLAAEIRAGKREKFGLTFIDADSRNNWTYLDQAIDMSHPRAFIVLDNMNMKALSEEDGPRKAASQDCILKAGRDKRIDSTLMQTAGNKGWGGFLLCMVKDSA